MSIQSEIDRISLEVTTQTSLINDLIEQANSLPEAGSGGGAEPTIQALEVTENGTYTPPEGVDGYAPVTVAVPESGGEADSGVRRVQFTVMLDADSLYLPLDGLTEIPEILQITSYDVAMITATSGYGSAATPVSDHITDGAISVLPIKLINNNSGTVIRLAASSVMGYQMSNNLRGYSFWSSGSDRLEGAGIGWSQPSNIQDAAWQNAFITAVGKVGYALNGDTLCIKNKNTNAKTFATGVEYLVTALYDVIPSTANGYATVDRSVNSTNVTETVE